jgi:iron complex outermembrane receptor protein
MTTTYRTTEVYRILMEKNAATLFLCAICAGFAVGQQGSSNTAQQGGTTVPSVQQSVLVTTSAEPLPMEESERSVEVLLPQGGLVGTDSVVDVLRTDASLNLQARGGEGVQADLAIRGTTFEQSLVMVNGPRRGI